MTRREFTFIDLFAAPGGFSLGFEMAGFKALAGVDIDPVGMKTYSFNFPKAKAIVMDIRRLESRVLMRLADVDEGQVDVIIGGPPCQGFSTIGRVKIASLVRSGVWNNLTNSHPRFIDDPRNVLYKEFMRIVRDLKPLFVVMENVPGMMSYRNGEIVKEILEDFKAIGYRAQVRVLNAADYGVPQIRKRIIFIATRLENAPIRFPDPTHGKVSTKSLSLLEYTVKESSEGVGCATLKPYVTVWDAIGDLPSPAPGRLGLADVPLPYDKPPFSDYQKFMREWGGGSPDGKLHNHVARQHSERDVKTFQILKEGQWWEDLPEEIKRLYGYRDDIFHDKMKKLIRNAPSWTITAHLYKDGYMYVHPVEPRTITVREAARLQSFPDRFIFKGSRTEQFKQVGNAVPPLMARAIAMEIRKILEEVLP
jgi:DNA (cytosine-5)-methyltransferase 1